MKLWRLMIVDDEKIIRQGLTHFVRDSGYPFEVVAEAKNANESLQYLETLPLVHVCLVDINMPNMNGLDLISLLKERCPSIVVVVISGYDNFEYARQAVQLQAFDYVLKPIPKSDLNQLLARLDKHLRNLYPDAVLDEPVETSTPTTFTGNGTVFIDKVTEYIQAHYQDPELSISRIGSLFHINPTYLSKRMKQEIGLSFLDYVTELRINKAKEVLDDVASNIKISSLAIKVGYKNQYYFSRVFKNKVGLSPLEYKNNRK